MVQKPNATIVMVNGIDCLVGAKLTFDQVIALAGCPADTVTFSRGPNTKPQGILFPGETVWTKPGMIFTATATGSA